MIYGDDWSSDEEEDTSSDGIYQARASLENNSSNPSEHYFSSGRSLPVHGHYELDYGTYTKCNEKYGRVVSIKLYSKKVLNTGSNVVNSVFCDSLVAIGHCFNFPHRLFIHFFVRSNRIEWACF